LARREKRKRKRGEVGLGEAGFANGLLVDRPWRAVAGFRACGRLASQRFFSAAVGRFGTFYQLLGGAVGAGGPTSCFKRTVKAGDSRQGWWRFSTVVMGGGRLAPPLKQNVGRLE
jgi:hypothetical protein